MPIYEYRCGSCLRVIEAIQKMDDAPLERCEACGGRLEKLISRAAFHLKGGGWFDQGYGAPATPATPDKPAKPAGASDSEGSGGTSSDSPKKAAGGSCGAGCGCH